MRTKMAAGAAAVLLLCILTAGCSLLLSRPDAPAENELQMIIQLDLAEDIGFLVVDYQAGSAHGSGGVSNADKTALARDSKLYFEVQEEHMDGAQDSDKLQVTFTVVAPGIEPNMENDYPPEYLSVLQPIELPLQYGSSQEITITGNQQDGYSATQSIKKAAR